MNPVRIRQTVWGTMAVVLAAFVALGLWMYFVDSAAFGRNRFSSERQRQLKVIYSACLEYASQFEGGHLPDSSQSLIESGILKRGENTSDVGQYSRIIHHYRPCGSLKGNEGLILLIEDYQDAKRLGYNVFFGDGRVLRYWDINDVIEADNALRIERGLPALALE